MEMTEYVYTCSAGETFDSVARALWDHEKYAAELMCANPEMTDRLVFDGSEKLFIPLIDIQDDMIATAVPDRAPWRE